jgi:putative oxidoreductase
MFVKTVAPTWGIAIVRVMMGIILVVAAWEKFSAGGLFGFIPAVTRFGFPAPQFFGVLVPCLEGIGGLLVLAGLGARWVAVLFVVEFAVNALVLKTASPPPFGGWDSMRIDLMLLASAVMLVLCGPGHLALETLLMRRRSPERIAPADQPTGLDPGHPTVSALVSGRSGRRR